MKTNVYLKLMHRFPLIHRFKWINHTKTDGPAKYSQLLRLRNGGCFSDKKILTFRITAGLLALKSCIHVKYYLKIKFTPPCSKRNNLFKEQINSDVVISFFLSPPPSCIVGILKKIKCSYNKLNPVI